MECKFFGIDRPTKEVKITLWNINGICNKLENTFVKTWINESDIVFLNETKTSMDFKVPGYQVYQDTSKERSRGGVAVLVKNSLKEYVSNVDISVEGQIWIKLSFLPKLEIGGCYIPPPDSPYFDIASFAKIREHCMNNDCTYIILGDLNGRCGK